MTLAAFVISWTGKHQNSLEIAKAIAPLVDDLALVYSDRDAAFVVDTVYPSIKTPDEFYFGKKFKVCLDACKADLMLVITGDVTCCDWVQLIRKCQLSFSAFPDLGVWAPLINYSSWKLPLTRKEKLEGSSLNKVVQTDSIVFAMKRSVVTRLKEFDYDCNVYGWGVDWAAMAYCYANGLFAAVDDSVQVSHPQTTTYDEQVCVRQMHDFLWQLSHNERLHYLALQAHLRRFGNSLPPGAGLPPWYPAVSN